jgi:dihydroorotase
MRTVIKNGHLIDASKDYGIADLYLKDGRIEGVNLEGQTDQTFDANGYLVTPAFIDLHAHLREPGQEVKEDLQSGLSAAAGGGYGTVISMANTSPTVDEAGIVADLVAKAERIGQARLRPAAALSHGLKGETLTDFAALKEAGAVMITDDGIPVKDSHLMRRAGEYAAELGLVIQTHSEDPSLRQNGVMNEGVVSQRLGLPGNPISAEAIMIYRDCEIAWLTGARVHIAHISSKRGMQIVEWFKSQGANVTAEVSPHHLTLTDEAMELFDPMYKVAPPLRTGEDVEYLRDAIKRGIVDNIGTDHAPHTKAEKERDMVEAPFGIGNIEVTFPLLYTELVNKKVIELQTLLTLLQTGPATVMKWEVPSLQVGKAADITVLDLQSPKEVTPATFKSKAKFSPWAGQSLQGWPVATFVRGKQVFGKIIVKQQ